MRQAIAIVTLVASVGLVAAGCGGGDESSSATPTVDWADGFCTATTSWTDELQAIGDRFDDSSSLSLDTVEEAVGDARDATQSFLDDVRALGRPDTQSGQQAVDELNELATELESSVDRIEEEVSGASGITGAISASAVVVVEVAKMALAVQSTRSRIEGDVSSELQDAFKQADSCDGIG